MEQNPSSSSKADRKTVEKNRRNQMKTLFSQLISLVPHHPKVRCFLLPKSFLVTSSFFGGQTNILGNTLNYLLNFALYVIFQELLSLPDQIGEATNYIKNMEIKLEKLKERRDSATGARTLSNDTMVGSFRVPQVDVQEMGSALQVVLITGPESQFMFTETIRLLHEEGVEVVNASFSVVDNAIYHTVHSEVILTSRHC